MLAVGEGGWYTRPLWPVAWRLAAEAAPRASGGLLQDAAQWPVCPQRAHFVLFIMSLFFHRLGLAVLRNFLKLGFLALDDLPELLPFPALPLPEDLPLPFFLDDSIFVLTKPRLSFFLWRYVRT